MLLQGRAAKSLERCRRLKCSYCGNEEVLYDFNSHIIVCSRCGTVIDDHPALPDTDRYLRDDSVPRYSGSFTHRVHDHGVGSTEIAGNLRRHIQEGRTWVARNIDAKISKQDKKLVKALKELNELAKRLGAPSVVAETAGEILHKVARDANFKEQTLKKIVAASLFVAYKKCGYPRPVKLFSKEVGMSEREIWEGLRRLSELDKESVSVASASEPRSYVNYIVSSLKLPQEVGALASEILTKTKEHPLISGKSPASMAAAAVYLASIILSSRKNQLEVGSSVGQTDVAVRNAYSALINHLDIYVMI